MPLIFTSKITAICEKKILLPYSIRIKVTQKHLWVTFQCYIACIILVSIAIIVYNRYCLTIRSPLGCSCSAFTNSWSISQTRSWRLADASRNQSFTLCADFVCSHNFFLSFAFPPAFLCTERTVDTPLNRSVIYRSASFLPARLCFVDQHWCTLPMYCLRIFFLFGSRR